MSYTSNYTEKLFICSPYICTNFTKNTQMIKTVSFLSGTKLMAWSFYFTNYPVFMNVLVWITIFMWNQDSTLKTCSFPIHSTSTHVLFQHTGSIHHIMLASLAPGTMFGTHTPNNIILLVNSMPYPYSPFCSPWDKYNHFNQKSHKTESSD